MKVLSVNLYSYNELSDDAKERVISSAIKEAENCDWLLEGVISELTASLEAICEESGVKLLSYSYGTYDRDHHVKVENYHLEDLSGNRALAWFLRVLMRHGYARPKTFRGMSFPGVCGFTGVCYDEDIVETIWESLLDGDTVRKAFDSVSQKLCDICEAENEYLTSREYILESLDTSEEIYLINGERN